MATKKTTRIHIELDLAQLDDGGRQELLTGILQLAPESPLLASVPAVKASVTSLGTLGASLRSSNDLVTADAKKLQFDTDMRDRARASFDKELLTLKSLVENNAASDADISGMSFSPRGPKAAPAPLVAPTSIDVKPGKAHGQFTATVRDLGPEHRRYLAEVSLDPTGAAGFAQVPGTGKSRKLAGYKSGALVWIRFAAVSSNAQSEWSTPVSIIVP